MSIQCTAYTGEADLQPIADLLNACEAVDYLEEGTSVDELRTDLSSTGFHAGKNLSLWKDDGGSLVGFGKMWVFEPGQTIDGRLLSFQVRPDMRSSDLASRIIAWGEDRMRELGQGTDTPITLHARIQEQATEQIALLEEHGYTIDRYFFTMARRLADPIPEHALPAGFILRQVAVETDGSAWVALFNESWIDHWNSHPETIEHFNEDLTNPYYRADLDLIALAPDGTFAAFCCGNIPPEENQRSGRNDGWIQVLGTRPGFRNLGLGRAMLRVGLQRLQAAGAETARLSVDAASLTGATRLYESEGFRPVETRISYVKQLR